MPNMSVSSPWGAHTQVRVALWGTCLQCGSLACSTEMPLLPLLRNTSHAACCALLVHVVHTLARSLTQSSLGVLVFSTVVSAGLTQLPADATRNVPTACNHSLAPSPALV